MMNEIEEGTLDDAVVSTAFAFPHFKFVAKEASERLRVCSLAVNYIEDLADIESSLGKSLAKIGKQPICAGKSELMPNILSTWDLALRMITEFGGKHHSNISFVISQNMSKVLSDTVRLNNKRVQDITNKIKNQHQEFTRSRQAYLRLYEKYEKAVKDAETAVSQRYVAVEMERKSILGKEKEKTVKDSFNKMIAKIHTSDLQKKWPERFADIAKDLDTSEHALKITCQKLNIMRDAFLTDVNSALKEYNNLEFSRLSSIRESLLSFSHTQSLISDEIKESFSMLIAQVENIKIDEEISALLRSVDIIESYDINNIEVLTTSDQEKHINIVSADFCSTERTKNFSIIFHKLQQILEILDFLKDLVNNIGITIKSVGESKRIYSKALYKCFEKHGYNSSLLSSSTSNTNSINTSNTSSQENNQIQIFNFNNNTNSNLNTSNNMNINMKSKSLKHFQTQFQSATGLDSTISNMFSDLNSEQFFELLQKIESPLSIAVWNATVSALKGIADGHNDAAEKYYEYFLPTLSSVQRRIYAMKGDLMSKQVSNMKLIDTSQATVLKLSQKIEKIKFQIRIQQEKIEKSKEDISMGGTGCSTPPPHRIDGPGTSSGSGVGAGCGMGAGSGMSSGSGSALSPGDAEWENQMIAAGLRSVSPMNVYYDDDSNGNQKKDEIRRKATKAFQQGFDQFGSSLQKARMSVVAGLTTENLEEKLSRREIKLMGLENEEKELLTVFYAANLNMEVIEETVKNEINSCLSSAKEVITHDVLSFVDILKQLSINQQEGIVHFENPIKNFGILCESINSHHEIEHFISSVCESYLLNIDKDKDNDKDDIKNKNIFSEKINMTETPSKTNFVSLYNKIIDDERILLGLATENSDYGIEGRESIKMDDSKMNSTSLESEFYNNNNSNDEYHNNNNIDNDGNNNVYQSSQSRSNFHLFSTSSSSSSSPIPTGQMLTSSENFNFSSDSVGSPRKSEMYTNLNESHSKSNNPEVINMNINSEYRLFSADENVLYEDNSPLLSPLPPSHSLSSSSASACHSVPLILPTAIPVFTPSIPIPSSFTYLNPSPTSHLDPMKSNGDKPILKNDPQDYSSIPLMSFDSHSVESSPTGTSSHVSNRTGSGSGSGSIGISSSRVGVLTPSDISISYSNSDITIKNPTMPTSTSTIPIHMRMPMSEEYSPLNKSSEENSSSEDVNNKRHHRMSLSSNILNVENFHSLAHTTQSQTSTQILGNLRESQEILIANTDSYTELKAPGSDCNSAPRSGPGSGAVSSRGGGVVDLEFIGHNDLLKNDILVLETSSPPLPLSSSPPTLLPPRPPLPPRSRRSSDVKEKMISSNTFTSDIADSSNAEVIMRNNQIHGISESSPNSKENDKVLLKNIQIDDDMVKYKMNEDEHMNYDGKLYVSNENIERSPGRENIPKKDLYDSPTIDLTRENSYNNIKKATVPVSTGNKIEDSNELVKFGLSPNLRILESFSCALYPKKGLLTHGRMFITQHYLAFSGWPELRVLLELKEIVGIEKSNTLYYIPNAILINSESYGEFFFGSFIDRDVCFALLNNMSQIAKRLIEIKRDDNTLSPDIEELVFGLRIPKESYLGGIQAKATASWNALPLPLPSIPILSTGVESSLATYSTLVSKIDFNSIDNGTNIVEYDNIVNNDYDSINHNSNTNSNNTIKNNNNDNKKCKNIVSDMNQSVNEFTVSVTSSSSSTSSSISQNIETISTSTSSQIPSQVPGSPSTVNNNYLKDNIDFATLYNKHSIVSLCTNVLPYRFKDVMRSCWLSGSGYGDFLTGEGDIEIGYGEWTPVLNPKVPEDVAGLSFSFSREFHYSHPRTTMLMFGPKNAPAKQNHYLYLPLKNNKKTKINKKNDGNNNADEHNYTSFIEEQNVPKGVIMIVTQFDGIPMADCFKIIQYWSFDDSLTSVSTTVRIGVSVHFIKYTMLKSQVRDGVKEELTAVANNWCKFALTETPKSINNTKVENFRGQLPVHTLQQLPSIPAADLNEQILLTNIYENNTENNNGNENEDNVQNVTSMQKDKRVPRKLPKIFFSKTSDETPFSLFSLASYRAVINTIINTENRLTIIFMAFIILILLTQFRNQLILSNRLHTFGKVLESLQHAIIAQERTNSELRNMMEKCPNMATYD